MVVALLLCVLLPVAMAGFGVLLYVWCGDCLRLLFVIFRFGDLLVIWLVCFVLFVFTVVFVFVSFR